MENGQLRSCLFSLVYYSLFIGVLMKFPLALEAFQPLKLDMDQKELSMEQEIILKANIQLSRDAIVFFTAVAEAKGLGGHTGGAYDVVPEVLIADGFVSGSDRFFPVYFDEAGHRVALQYLIAVLHRHLPADALLHYREFGFKLPGHPERHFTPGIDFSSGRLGHLWPYVNGVALANPQKIIFLLGSDGSQQEGNEAEAARFAVSQKLSVKLLIDDNDVTIAGHPSQYLHGFDLEKTLLGHGLQVSKGSGENVSELYRRMQQAIHFSGPVAVLNQRRIAPGIAGLEGSHKAHDAIKVSVAIDYLKARHPSASEFLAGLTKPKTAFSFRGSGPKMAKNREYFGQIVCQLLQNKTVEERKSSTFVIDSDLEGSCGLTPIREKFPEIYRMGGIMERGNFSAAAGFGSTPGKQGLFATFSAFLEMIVSEITMARLNECNVLAHFSHAGVDEMADNTCHFGINNFFAANGLPENDSTRLYFPADPHQMKAVLETIFFQSGLRFLFSTRSAVPEILNSKGSLFFGEGYKFCPGKEEVIREGSAGYVVSYGEMLYRALDAVEMAREEGISVGLINKPTLNIVDEEMLEKIGRSAFVSVVESQNRVTGLGIRYGTWLLERGYAPKYHYMGTVRGGNCGLSEQIPFQGLDSKSIFQQIKRLSQNASK